MAVDLGDWPLQGGRGTWYLIKCFTTETYSKLT